MRRIITTQPTGCRSPFGIARRPAADTGFDASDYGNAILWLEGEEAVGGPLSAWPNKINGAAASIVDDTSYPYVDVRADFPGVIIPEGSILAYIEHELPGAIGADAFHLFAVAEFDAITIGQAWYLGSSPNAQFGAFMQAIGPVYSGLGGGAAADNFPAIEMDPTGIVLLEYHRGISGDLGLRLNGVVGTSAGNPVLGNDGSADLTETAFRMGSDQGFTCGGGSGGWLGSILLYKGAVDADSVRAHYLSKYGITP